MTQKSFLFPSDRQPNVHYKVCSPVKSCQYSEFFWLLSLIKSLILGLHRFFLPLAFTRYLPRLLIDSAFDRKTQKCKNAILWTPSITPHGDFVIIWPNKHLFLLYEGKLKGQASVMSYHSLLVLCLSNAKYLLWAIWEKPWKV